MNVVNGTLKRKRGLALMDPERRREIASMGGRASQKRGTGHKWTEAEARVAGRKGALARHASGRAGELTE